MEPYVWLDRRFEDLGIEEFRDLSAPDPGRHERREACVGACDRGRVARDDRRPVPVYPEAQLCLTAAYGNGQVCTLFAAIGELAVRPDGTGERRKTCSAEMLGTEQRLKASDAGRCLAVEVDSLAEARSEPREGDRKHLPASHSSALASTAIRSRRFTVLPENSAAARPARCAKVRIFSVPRSLTIHRPRRGIASLSSVGEW
jgi:hypothetical protein